MADKGGERASRFSAWSALLGGVIAAVIIAAAGFAGPLYLQQHEERRDGRTEAAHARGAARLLFAEYLQAAAQMAILANDRILRRFDPSYRIEMRPEDMRLIASHIEIDRWGDLQESITNTIQLETFVNTLVERGRRRLTEGEVCLVLMDLRSIRHAGAALAPLAEAKGRPPPPEPLDCEPKPGPLPRDLAPRPPSG